MSLNISGSRFVRVYDTCIKPSFSDKILFANLVSSRKTGNAKVDKETGEVVINQETGHEVQERAYSRWEGRFVGNAFEPSKGLRDGDSIDINSGWITNEPFVGKDEKTHYKTVVYIAEFVPSVVADGEDTNVVAEE